MATKTCQRFEEGCHSHDTVQPLMLAVEKLIESKTFDPDPTNMQVHIQLTYANSEIHLSCKVTEGWP
jgi:hypothetical protein